MREQLMNFLNQFFPQQKFFEPAAAPTGQLFLEFFNPKTQDPPSEYTRKAYLDPTNPTSPYFGFIGNRCAVDRLIRIDFEALGNYNHACNNLNIAFIGQPGCGKTDLAHRHAKANRLPLVEISPKSVKKIQDIFYHIARVCDEHEMPLVELGRENRYVPPPINVFIDEVHALNHSVVDGLLKATEYNDGILVTEKGVTIVCKNIHWMIATTERGKLFDAFDTRFTKCILNLYTKEEVAKIVQVNNPEWEMSVCRLVAHFCSRVPREALAFAREMKLEHNMNSQTWVQTANIVARDNEIDEFGMTYKRLKILKNLGQGPVGAKRLPTIAGVKVEELEKFIMPWLLESTDDQEAMVGVSPKGFIITQAGLNALNLRRIPNKGMEAMAA